LDLDPESNPDTHPDPHQNKIRIRIRIRVICRIRVRIRFRIKVMRIHNTVSNRHDFGLESDIVALPIDTGPQSPWKGFNKLLTFWVSCIISLLFAFLCCAFKPARPNVFIFGLQNAIFISILASSYDLPVPIV
jgi:hypothetical protein